MLTTVERRFVEIDRETLAYVETLENKTLLNRYIRRTGDVAALFPFDRLAHSFMVTAPFGNWFNANKERHHNNEMRRFILQIQQIRESVDRSKWYAVQKTRHRPSRSPTRSCEPDRLEHQLIRRRFE